jgi:diadenylate cyclase
VGALFAVERRISLKTQHETGVTLGAEFSKELAMSVFYPKSPLHDGGMILADEKVVAAACVFPVSQKELADRSTGLRHRAAMGLTEETDAVCVVVSEETGSISICLDGVMERNLSEEAFRARMAEIFLSKPKNDEKGISKALDSEERGAGSGDRDLDDD